MRSKNERSAPNTYRDLQILSEVEETPEVTQRGLSQKTGVALGLTNVMLRNLIQKGYVRASQAGWKRWLYTLTTEGISHIRRLTVTYVHRVLEDYKSVRQTLRVQLEPLQLNEESRIAIYGTGEFAELVYLGLKEFGIEEIEVFGPDGQVDQKFLGLPVQELASLDSEHFDRIMVAYLGNDDSISYKLEAAAVDSSKVVVFFQTKR